jgi:hypothetical protein
MMKKIFLSLLLPLFACGADSMPSPVLPAGSVRRTPSTNGLVEETGDGNPGGNLDKCAAAECNDRDRRKDYVDPPPDETWQESARGQAPIAHSND